MPCSQLRVAYILCQFGFGGDNKEVFSAYCWLDCWKLQEDTNKRAYKENDTKKTSFIIIGLAFVLCSILLHGSSPYLTSSGQGEEEEGARARLS